MAGGAPLVGDRLAEALESAARDFWLEVRFQLFVHWARPGRPKPDVAALLWSRSGCKRTRARTLASRSGHDPRFLQAAARCVPLRPECISPLPAPLLPGALPWV